MKVQVLWIDECPSYRRAHDLLEQVLREQGIDMPIEMIQLRGDADARAQKFPGSPTIRINGRDLFESSESSHFGILCRVYGTPAGLSGAPTKEMIRSALLSHLAPEMVAMSSEVLA